MKPKLNTLKQWAVTLFVAFIAVLAQAADKKPNIVCIMGDDIGIWNIGAYSRGMMAGRTPNLDQLAKVGMLFTDYYAEASCTAGRANFITGELPIRTGMTTVGQAGSKIGMPAAAPTIATALKSMGYATGQFGKNHLGDLNEFLPTVHGFDEFFGYLYHLDAMEDPSHRNYPPALKDTVGPRNMVHSWATDTDDPTVQPRWGKIGKQKIEDAGTLYPKRMETVDDEILDQPGGWLGGTVKVDWPVLCNLRLDPFERTGMPSGDKGSLAYYNWFAYEFWRFTFVQQEVGKYAMTFLEYPPMQEGASFNMEALKAELEKKMEQMQSVPGK